MYGEKPRVTSRFGAWFALLGGCGFFSLAMAYIVVAFGEGDFRAAMISLLLIALGVWFVIPALRYLRNGESNG